MMEEGTLGITFDNVKYSVSGGVQGSTIPLQLISTLLPN